MTCHRRYQFDFESDHGHVAIAQLVADRFSDASWLEDVHVLGEGTELLYLIMTVSGRDQWFVHKRAMTVAETVSWTLEAPVPVPLWDVLPPHTNRGYSRYRR